MILGYYLGPLVQPLDSTFFRVAREVYAPTGLQRFHVGRHVGRAHALRGSPLGLAVVMARFRRSA